MFFYSPQFPAKIAREPFEIVQCEPLMNLLGNTALKTQICCCVQISFLIAAGKLALGTVGQ